MMVGMRTGEGLWDKFTEYGWKDTINNCPRAISLKKYVRINYPEQHNEEDEEPLFVWSGFATPGKHIILLYDPD